MFDYGLFGAQSPDGFNVSHQDASTTGPLNARVLFSPDQDIQEEIIRILSLANERILFLAFSFTLPEIAQTIIAAHNKGIKVYGVFEKIGASQESSQMDDLLGKNIPLRVDGNPSMMHHKVMVIDDYVITGSLNFSSNAIRSNDESVLIIKDKTIAHHYEEEFWRIWSVGTEPTGDNGSN